MAHAPRPTIEEVEHLMLNAQLRSELEPFLDESVDLLNLRHLPTPDENEYLASMLAWEKAPVLRISQWFEPELKLPAPDTLEDAELGEILSEAIDKIYSMRIMLDYTDHLSDRELYTVLYRDILPSCEKKIDLPRNFLHWHCLDPDEETETWLRYYASPKERREWIEQNGREAPPLEPPPFPRKMPRRPLS